MRLITSALVIGLCLLAVSRGWVVVQGAHALAARSGGFVSRDWMGEPRVPASAVGVAIDEMGSAEGVEAASRHAESLTQLLSERPLFPTAWLALAGTRLATGADYGEVLAAFKMSSVTAPNEEAVMWERGVFGLLQWEALPPEARERTIADLSGVMLYGVLWDDQVASAKRVLAAKAPEFRAQIATMLADAGVQPNLLMRFGLSPVAPR